MKHLTSIVAMDHKGAIGVGNHLPWRLKSDMRFFRETTMGNVVVLGRKTYESLGSKALPGRYNVVLSHNAALLVDPTDTAAAQSIAEGLAVASKAARDRDCFIIGGASIYAQFAPFVDRYLITLVDKKVVDADTFFDHQNLIPESDWDVKLHRRVEANETGDEADFVIFELTAKRPAEIKAARDEAIEAYMSNARQQSRQRRPNSRRPFRESEYAATALI